LQRGGTHLGGIVITGAQIGRQQKNSDKPSGDDEKEYRHAFLIVEAKKGPGGSHPRHVLCAESDSDRDSWVEMLVRYVSGSFNEDPGLALGPSPINTGDNTGSAAPRSSTSSIAPFGNNLLDAGNSRRPQPRVVPRDDFMKVSQLSTSSGVSPEGHKESSPVKSVDPSPIDRQGPGGFTETHTARKILERGHQQTDFADSLPQPSSLPSTSPLDNVNGSLVAIGQRSNSELGQYSDMLGYGRRQRDHSPEQRRQDHPGDMPAFLNSSAPNLVAQPDHRAPSPEKVEASAKAKISAPIGGAPIPVGYKFGGKDPTPDPAALAAERREKAKSRSFWGFGRPHGGRLFFRIPSFVLNLS
jgi:RalA-binding protein 1